MDQEPTYSMMAIDDDHPKALQRLSENIEGESGWNAVEQHAQAIADSLRASDAGQLPLSSFSWYQPD